MSSVFIGAKYKKYSEREEKSPKFYEPTNCAAQNQIDWFSCDDKIDPRGLSFITWYIGGQQQKAVDPNGGVERRWHGVPVPVGDRHLVLNTDWSLKVFQVCLASLSLQQLLNPPHLSGMWVELLNSLLSLPWNIENKRKREKLFLWSSTDDEWLNELQWHSRNLSLVTLHCCSRLASVVFNSKLSQDSIENNLS